MGKKSLEMDKKVRNVGVLTAVTSLVAVILILNRSCAYAGTPDGRLARIKEFYKFSEWGGTVKIPGNNLSKLPIAAADFRGYGRTKIITAERERDKHLSVEILGSGVEIDLRLHESALAAHEAMMRRFTVCSAPLSFYRKAEQESPMDIGDVCFFHTRSQPPAGALKVADRMFLRSVRFARSNVGVRIRKNAVEGSKYLDIVELAKFIDAKITRQTDRGGGEASAKWGETVNGLRCRLLASPEKDEKGNIINLVVEIQNTKSSLFRLQGHFHEGRSIDGQPVKGLRQLSVYGVDEHGKVLYRLDLPDVSNKYLDKELQLVIEPGRSYRQVIALSTARVIESGRNIVIGDGKLAEREHRLVAFVFHGENCLRSLPLLVTVK